MEIIFPICAGLDIHKKDSVRYRRSNLGIGRGCQAEHNHYEAIREAMVNAIVHRDYSRIGGTVCVFMYPDRVEVRSPGGLLPGITLEDLVAMRVTSVPATRCSHNFSATFPVTWSVLVPASGS